MAYEAVESSAWIVLHAAIIIASSAVPAAKATWRLDMALRERELMVLVPDRPGPSNKALILTHG